ncbi:DUF2851 family protein [bacterium]|nr:DUF2851 family protein [bacterium]
MFVYSNRWPSGIVRENVQRISEKLIQAIWDNLFLTVDDIRTTKNLSVKILDRGQWNFDAGPDFIGATIRIGEEVLVGDVEIHWRSSDWNLHFHTHDEKYNRVIVHAVFIDDDPSPQSFHTIELKNFLGGSIIALSERIQKANSKNDSIYCYDQLPAIQPETVKNWILHNGLLRLKFKAGEIKRLKDTSQLSVDEIFYRGMMEALGFSKNRKPFLRLAEIIPYRLLVQLIQEDEPSRALMRMQAILLGAAGLLRHDLPDATSVPFIQRLEDLWAEFQNQHSVVPMQEREWKFFKLRPANFPTMRIAGMAKFITTFKNESLAGIFLNILKLHSDPNTIIAEMEKSLITTSYGYWSTHYAWGDEGKRGHTDLIGEQRAFEIIVNVIWPILLMIAEESADNGMIIKLIEVYGKVVSREKNTITQAMKRQLENRWGENQKTPYSMQYAQGLIQLHHRCNEYNCSSCPIFDTLMAGKS